MEILNVKHESQHIIDQLKIDNSELMHRLHNIEKKKCDDIEINNLKLKHENEMLKKDLELQKKENEIMMLKKELEIIKLKIQK